MWEAITLWSAWITLILMAAGLYEPWYVLWWKASQNRKQVIQIYGTLSLILFLIYNLLRY